jgi:hypothetical protein
MTTKKAAKVRPKLMQNPLIKEDWAMVAPRGYHWTDVDSYGARHVWATLEADE